MPIKPYSRAKYNVERIANPHPDHQEQIRWNIEGESLTSDEIIERNPEIPASSIRSRLHSGIRTWALLLAPKTKTLKLLNSKRRRNGFDESRNGVMARNAKKLAHAKVE